MKNVSLGSSSLQDDYKQFLLLKLTTAAHSLVNDKENELLQVEFCRRVEMIMFYGIKSRPFKWKSESQDVWELLRTISPKHIIEDIFNLSSVKTDSGRIRAWIRITINECSLQSFIPLFVDQKINKKFYESSSIFNDPDKVERLIEQISSTSGCKVVFNTESFDFQVAPSATDLTQYKLFSKADPHIGAEVSRSGSINCGPEFTDSIQSQETIDSSVTQSSSEVTEDGPDLYPDSLRIDSTFIPNSDSINSRKSCTSNQIKVHDVSEPSTFTPSSLVVGNRTSEFIKLSRTPDFNEIEARLDDGGRNSDVNESQDELKEGNERKLNSGDPGENELTPSNNTATAIEMPEEETSQHLAPLCPVQGCDIENNRVGASNSINSNHSPNDPSPESETVPEGVGSMRILCGEESQGTVSIDDSTSVEHASPPSLLSPHDDSATPHQIELYQQQEMSASGEAGSPDVGQSVDVMPVNLIADSTTPDNTPPVNLIADNTPPDNTYSPGNRQRVNKAEDVNTDLMSHDIVPSSLKDVLVEDEEVSALKNKLGNSLYSTQEFGMEMLAHKVEEFDDPYGEEEDGSSAVSLSSSPEEEEEEDRSEDNNLAHHVIPGLEEDDNDDCKEVGSVPVPTITRDVDPPQALSLGSSLYKLFIRGATTSDPESERLSNLAALHSAVTDEVPISNEEDISTRSYLMGATRATVAYTYESANQWLSHSKDMWWWLQRRVITEHECQHPTPPTSETIRSGSPNSSSLLDLCTEQCSCCNAIVIDFCNKDIQDPNAIPISKSCPPFSSITHHMNSPISRAALRSKSASESKDHYSIDILQNPSPSVTSLNEAIELQKTRTQNTISDEDKKREMDVLVQLRKKKYDLQSSDSSSSDTDNTITILGHSLTKSSELSGYCAKCGFAIYRRIKAAFSCGACHILLHKACLNDVTRKCSLANKDELLLETRLTPAHGLHEQNYCCFDCSAEISYSASKVNMCDYSGRYYCHECHKRTMNFIPARVLHNWDFKPRPVALQSYEVISYLTNKQYLNLEQLNAELFNFVEVLRQVRALREQVILYKAHFVQCSRAMQEGMFLKLRSRQHFIDTSKLYTLQDLLEIHSAGLLTELSGVVADYRTHYEQCDTCSNQKFVCAVCGAPPAIRPFSTECFNIAQCFTCHGVMHRECFNRSSNCPYCTASLIYEN